MRETTGVDGQESTLGPGCRLNFTNAREAAGCYFTEAGDADREKMLGDTSNA